MGGWNIIADVLLREVPQGADPLGPENMLIFAPGVLTGLAISGASRNAVGGKSPITGGFGATEVGGNWGAQFKRAGFDALIVEGVVRQARLPVDQGRRGRDPRRLAPVGQDHQGDRRPLVREELGEQRAELTMIGPGGENLVQYACVMNGLKDAAGRYGHGRGDGLEKAQSRRRAGHAEPRGRRPRHDPRDGPPRRAGGATRARGPRGLHEAGTGGKALEGGILSGNMPIRNFRDGEFPEISGLEYIMDKIGVKMEGCWACAVRCKKVVKAEAPYKVDPDYGGPEYETIGSLGSTCGVSDIVAVSRANELCNAYSLDTIGAGVTIAFAMECFEEGLLTLEDTGGIELRFGNGDAMVADGREDRPARGHGRRAGRGPAARGGQDRPGRRAVRRARQGAGAADARAAAQARPGDRLCRLAHRRRPLPLAARHGPGLSRRGRLHAERRAARHGRAGGDGPGEPGAGKGARHDL